MRFIFSLLCAVAFLCGCSQTSYREQIETARRKSEKQTHVKNEPAKLPVQVVVKGFNTSLSDTQGKTVWKVRADGAVIGDAQGNSIGTLKNGFATLHELGKAKATMRADALTADKVGQFVTGRGNVSAKSLSSDAAGKTIRADTMRWDIKKKILTGQGNVVLTQEPDMVLHADSFRADLALRVVDFETASGKVGTGF